MVFNMSFDKKSDAKQDDEAILYNKIKQSIESDQIKSQFDDKDEEKLAKISDNAQLILKI